MIRRYAPFLLAMVAVPSVSRATTYTDLYNFSSVPTGYSPDSNVVVDASGNLYGLDSLGGASNNGTVWMLPKGASTPSVIASFNGTNGNYPGGAITLDSQGNMFGTAFFGGSSGSGSSGSGTVWEIAKGSGTISTLYNFPAVDGSGYNTTGKNPEGVTVAANGNIYGTTQDGGASGGGTLWMIAKGSNTATVLHTFTGTGTDGKTSYAQVTVDSHGNLFGTTTGGGTYGMGTVWEYNPSTGTFSTIYSFTGGADGAVPEGAVTVDANGNIYGTAASKGSGGTGTVWKIAAGTSTLTVLHSFAAVDGTAGNVGGAAPYAGLSLDSSGDLFGVTASGGTSGGFGVAFEITSGGAYSVVYQFQQLLSDGGHPTMPLTMDSSGNLFSVVSGGPSLLGLVYELSGTGASGPAVGSSGPATDGMTYTGTLPPSNIPEPATIVLLGSCLFGLSLTRRHRA